jgi:hypothetical protein
MGLKKQAQPNKGKTDMIEAIRNHPAFGRGSCSVIDECYSDTELAEALAGEGITTVKAALAWAERGHDIWADQMEDAINSAF